VLCRICDSAVDPALPPNLLDAAISDLIGERTRFDAVAAAFAQASSLRFAGSAIDRLSMRAHTPPHLTKLDLLSRALPGLPWDWGFQGSGCFWARTQDLATFIELATSTLLAAAPTHPASGANTWPAAFERLFASIALGPDRQLGLLDHALDAASAKFMLVNPQHPAATRPMDVLARLFGLHQDKHLASYLLLQDTRLLDPWWYYQTHADAADGWEDCLQHHLANATPALNAAHAAKTIGYGIHPQGLVVNDAQGNTVRTIARRHDYLSDVFSPSATMQPGRGARDDIKVSVVCMTYNQGHLLRECLQSLLTQQTDFAYEVIVGNDASSDDTRSIIDEFAAAHPGKLLAVHRDANLGPAANMADLLARARGQYVAMCEGDDFWTSPHKLQLQADHLDAHPRCSLHFHAVSVLDQAQDKAPDCFPKDLGGQVFTHDHIARTNFVPTNGVLYRRTARLESLLSAGKDAFLPMLDWLGHILAALEGELHMSTAMLGVYRKHAGGIWSQHTGASFIPRWGMFYTRLQQQSRIATGDLHHALYCQRELEWFGKLFHFHFVNADAASLHELLRAHLGCAQYFLAQSGLDIDPGRIDDADELAAQLRDCLSVSTIVATRNDAAHLARCLASIEGQRGLFGHEVIITDDASTDASVAIASEFIQSAGCDVKLLASRRQQHGSNALRGALASCRSGFVALCQGSDYWTGSDKLAKQLAHLLLHPRQAMCFTWQLQAHTHGAATPHAGQAVLEDTAVELEQLLATDLTGGCSSHVYRREVLERLQQLPVDLTALDAHAQPLLAAAVAASQGPVGFIRDLLTCCRVDTFAPLSGKHPPEPVLDCLRRILPDLHSRLPRPTMPESDWPTRIRWPANPDLRLHLDRLAPTPATVQLSGWFVQASAESRGDEEKFVFLTDGEGRVVHAQRMDNVRRPDVTRFYRDKQGISNRTFDWAGFRTLVSPLPADGSYRIAIGRRSEDGTIQALACPGSLRIVDGVPDY